MHFTHGNPKRRNYKTKVCDGRLLFTDQWWTVFIDKVTCEKCLEKLRLVGEAANRRSKKLSNQRRKRSR